MGFWDALFGGGTKEIPATPLKQYPATADTLAAMAAGYGYGTPLDFPTAQVFGNSAPGPRGNMVFQPDVPQSHKAATAPDSTTTVNMQAGGIPISTIDSMKNDLYAAAIASNYVPLAALGLDPRKVNWDVSGEKMNIAGMYSPKNDRMYVSSGSSDNSTLLHEAVHRGIEKIRNDPALPKDIKRRMSGDNEEYFVRYLMEKFVGNPEQDTQAKNSAIINGINPPNSGDISKLNEIIAGMIAKDKPRGPR